MHKEDLELSSGFVRNSSNLLKTLKKPYKHLTLSHLAMVQYLLLSTPKNQVRNNLQTIYLSTCGQGTFCRNTVQILYVKNLLKEQISSVRKMKKQERDLMREKYLGLVG